MAMGSTVRTLPCTNSVVEVARSLSKSYEKTQRLCKGESSPSNRSLALTPATYASSVDVPSHAPEPCTFFNVVSLPTPTDDNLSRDGTFEDDDSASTYDEDEKSFEAGSSLGEAEGNVDDISLCCHRGSKSSAGRLGQARSWSLDKAELEVRYRSKVNEVVQQTFLLSEHAAMLLRGHRWNTEAAVEAWYSREAEMNSWLGLDEGTVLRAEVPSGPVMCGICMEESEETMTAACEEHRYCISCWGSYIDSAIDSGKEVLRLCCPHRGQALEGLKEKACLAAVSDSMILACASPGMRDLFIRLRLQSLVESDMCLRWCPAPGCSFAVQIDAEAAASVGVVEVSCMSGHVFCWGCGEEPHSPVDCETARMWLKLNSCEGEEISLMLENIKECPKCHVPIEKVGGCSHVECVCHHKFCWECRGSLDTHSDEDCKKNGLDSGLHQVKREELISRDSHSYGRHFLRWLECEEYERQAKSVIQDLATSSSEWRAAGETLTKIRDCWRRLKWAQAGGYFEEGQSLAFELLEMEQVEIREVLETLHGVLLNSSSLHPSKETSLLRELDYILRTRSCDL